MLKDIIKSVKIVESKWIDEEYGVIIELKDGAATALSEKIKMVLEKDPSLDLETAMVSAGPGHTAYVPVFELGRHSVWVVDFDDAWVSLEMVQAPWTRISVIMEGEQVCSLSIGFTKLKEGLDFFDYTTVPKGIPDNAWIEPLRLIREIFS